MIVTKSKQDLKPVLMDPKGAEVKEPYYLVGGDGQSIVIVSPGKNGIEFNKTIGFFHHHPGAEVYTCLFGQGVLVMQRNDALGEAKEFKVVMLSPGRQVGVPSGWGHCLVNIGSNFLVLAHKSLGSNVDRDEVGVLSKRGLAYYIVDKKGEVAFERNPNYRVHPQITTE